MVELDHADWLTNRYDDLLEEENDIAQRSLTRLSTRESYERVYRIRRAVQLSYQHKLLPKDEWTKSSEVRYPPSNAMLGRTGNFPAGRE